MTKSELIARLAARYPQLVAKDAEYAVKMILDAMTDSLVDGERIEIRGFGSFGLNHRPARVGRNPKSGEKVHVPEKFVPHFKAGKELRERVDRSQPVPSGVNGNGHSGGTAQAVPGKAGQGSAPAAAAGLHEGGLNFVRSS